MLLTVGSGDCPVLILLDLSATSDTVDHEIFIECLKEVALD